MATIELKSMVAIFVFINLTLSSSALQWKGIGFPMQSTRLVNGKATALHWKAECLSSYNIISTLMINR